MSDSSPMRESSSRKRGTPRSGRLADTPVLRRRPSLSISAVSAIRSPSRPLDGPAHIPPPLRTDTRRSVQFGRAISFDQFHNLPPYLFGILRERNVHRGRVALHARPMALEREGNTLRDAQRAEDSPSRKQADLAWRKAQFRRFLNGAVMKDKPVNHDAILANTGNCRMYSSYR